MLESLKNFFNKGADYDEYDEELEEDVIETQNSEQMNIKFEEKKPIENEHISFTNNKPKEAFKSMSQTTIPNSKLSVVLFKPTDFNEVGQIADQLNKKNTVVLNLEGTGKDISQRIVDFLSGVAYANDGRFNKVSNATYIITPHNVDMHGEEIGDFDASSLF